MKKKKEISKIKKEKSHYTITVSKAVYEALNSDRKSQQLKSINAVLYQLFFLPQDAEKQITNKRLRV